MSRPISLTIEGIEIISIEEKVMLTISRHVYYQLEANQQVDSQITDVIDFLKNEIEEIDEIEGSYTVRASDLLNIDGVGLNDFISLPGPLEGAIEIQQRGLNAESNSFRQNVLFFPRNSDQPIPFKTAGIFLEAIDKRFTLNKEEEAFRYLRQYLTISTPTAQDHHNLITYFQSAKSKRLEVRKGRFEKLEISKVKKVGLNITQTESKDLILTPNLIGAINKDEHITAREIKNTAGKEGTVTLYAGKELIQVEAEAREGIKEILSNQVIKKKEVDDFLKNPGSFIDASKVDLESGFSFRVQGVTRYVRIQNMDIESGDNDWFLSNVPLVEDEFEKYISDEIELDEFVERVEVARKNNSDSILFKEKEFPLPPREEFEYRVKEKRSAIRSGHEEDLTKKESKRNSEQASFDIKYFESNSSTVDLYSEFKLPNRLSEGLIRFPFEHQEIAINWIYNLYRTSLQTRQKVQGGILADDMGLGKTFSSLMGLKSIIEHHRENNENNLKCLMVVAPLSLLENWKSEVSNFFEESPFLDIVVLNSHSDLKQFRKDKGNERKQYFEDSEEKTNTAIKYILKVGEEYGEERLDKPGRLILTTYETLRDYQFSLAIIPFNCVIFDEAQKVKSPNSLATRAAKALNSELKIMATGTPVENDLEEYWCLMDTANPELFGSLKEFRDTYIKPLKDSEGDESIKLSIGKELYKKSGPFLLRRTKEELKDKLGKQLPTKTEYKGIKAEEVNYHSLLDKDLTPDQVSAFERIRTEVSRTPGFEGVLQNLHRIKACVLHPRLTFKNTIDHMASINRTEFWEESAKLTSMLEILYEVKSKDEKIIIFAISRSIQYMIKKWIKVEFGISPDIISGETKVKSNHKDETRMGMIDKFSKEPGFNIIILSPLAAGVGLNITSANHVFHLERHWNPAKEAQANDRVYRIGQVKDVSIYYPISKHPKYESFDIKLDRLLSKKTFTKDALITYPRMTENEIAQQFAG
jgi:SNF2 family DNA or RNA helicase